MRAHLFLGSRTTTADLASYSHSLLAIGGSSSQLGFYAKTGGELEWRDATAYATSKEGLKVLMTGSWAVLVSGFVLIIIACFAHGIFYRAIGSLMGSIGDDIASGQYHYPLVKLVIVC